MCLFVYHEETNLACFVCWFCFLFVFFIFWFRFCFLFSLFVSSPDTYSSLNLPWHKVSKHLLGWHTAQCYKQAQLTLGHKRIITDSKKYNRNQNKGRSHNTQQIQNVPWEGERGREEEKKEGEAQEIELRNLFTTDCTSVEEFPPRHCREVVQSYITGRRHLEREQGGFWVLGFPNLHCVWK